MNQSNGAWRWIRMGVIAGCIAAVTACGHSQPGDTSPGGGAEDRRTHALYDRDSRNNEDNSLGVKEKWVKDQQRGQGEEYRGWAALDYNNVHLTKKLRFDPQLAARLNQLPGIQSTIVLLTETNAYVAAVLDGQNPDHQANPELMAYQVTDKGGVSLFGADGALGTQKINWYDPNGMTYSLQDRIKMEVLKAMPDRQRVFATSNANFVQRLRFYAKEEQERGTFQNYVNEFNTMVQYAFPER
ncbi:hypothetical protein [Paenibacillus silviterrae]|uniref:hypothetical protein n=1 Tax=Paenibacillus silviterrae TaxID=3242194 RepID=UPI0025433D4D|nr:hypothetical protein [Paenibacillus chinjuensis]